MKVLATESGEKRFPPLFGGWHLSLLKRESCFAFYGLFIFINKLELKFRLNLLKINKL
jgi:hypothetical protein